ncbi:hypothetical protein [Actinophytocola xinjiangensis]|uniref:hypothetical protein n=1 Tax=Actinophytocola xinjiangensis TaxID=485602 RepID=UPI000A0099CE|nr:hypothetical protein [Actinophytocola xinjiangensis]
MTLLAAPPLESPLTVTVSGRRAFVRADDTLIASVVRVGRAPTAVPFVDLATARMGARGFRGRTEHPFPTCFVCGPDRTDGLRLAPGPVAGRRHTVACPWTPASDDPDLVWSVLDCPGGWVEQHGQRRNSLVLNRLSVVMLRQVEPGEPHVVVAERLGGRGRTVRVGSSVYTASRQLVAAGAAVWTEIPDGLRRGG